MISSGSESLKAPAKSIGADVRLSVDVQRLISSGSESLKAPAKSIGADVRLSVDVQRLIFKKSFLNILLIIFRRSQAPVYKLKYIQKINGVYVVGHVSMVVIVAGRNERPKAARSHHCHQNHHLLRNDNINIYLATTFAIPLRHVFCGNMHLTSISFLPTIWNTIT